MPIYESGEMYLETILLLKNENESVRAIDISKHLDISTASVSRALKNLTNEGFITIANDSVINFTQRGKELAEYTYEKHLIITKFLEQLGVSKDIATKDACKMEHIVSKETFQKIKDFLESAK